MFQYEGGTWKDGRRPSIWDAYSHSYSDRILDGSNGDVATDSYRLYKDDIALVKQMGMNTYRFSVSWSRVLPNGKLSGGINKRGIEYYNKVINEIISQGLTPFVTLLHLDYPQALQDEYDGFLSRRILNDFRNFADLCFKEFGDRVKYWVSINEPHTLSRGGFTVGDLAPGRCSNIESDSDRNYTCDAGNSSIEPYIVSHNQLLAHATVVQLYRRKYQAAQKGIIGMSMNVDWFIPYSSSEEDKRAANRSLDFMFGWFMDPITRGDYPESMKQYVGKRLPRFTKQESELMKGSFDFIGVNYYTGRYVIDQSNAGDHHHPGYLTDALASITSERNGKLLGPQTAAPWITVYPQGLTKVLLHIKEKYQNPLIYITENGVPETGNYTHSPLKATPDDNLRVSFYKEHLASVRSAIKQGANVKGFLVWSLLDCFEWLSGYHLKFGLYFVDPENPSIRIPKLSAIWFRKFLNGNS
ncbi:Beta-glucosidase 24 [Linum perenne]